MGYTKVIVVVVDTKSYIFLFFYFGEILGIVER